MFFAVMRIRADQHKVKRKGGGGSGGSLVERTFKNFIIWRKETDETVS